MKKLLKWVGSDGLLHFLATYVIQLTLTPVIGIWWALAIACVASVGKEAWDYFVEKDNNKEQVIHDLICDGVGILCSLVTVLIWALV